MPWLVIGDWCVVLGNSAFALGAELGDLSFLIDRNDGNGVDGGAIDEIVAIASFDEGTTVGRCGEEAHQIVAVASIDEHRRERGVVDGDVGSAADGVVYITASAGRVLKRELLVAPGTENRNVRPSSKRRAQHRQHG